MSAYYDIFNGDADGICALVQLRRAEPRPDAVLVTGVKRDIALLERVNAKAGDQLTVLDVSMRTNAKGLSRVLNAGAHVFYVDHHNAGQKPVHENLTALIDTSPETCTALIVDQCLDGQFGAWAVTAAFGDNFPKAAKARAQALSLSDATLTQLEQLGTLINYNAYGAQVPDLHFAPDVLYRHLAQFDTPMEFLAAKPKIFQTLQQGYRSDMEVAKAARQIDVSGKTLVLGLENAPSSRRVSGVFGNQLAQDHPERAHAILTRISGADKAYVVSVRAPLSNRIGADQLCLQFETGGGRAAAAGINHLPEADLNRFITAFRALYNA